METHSKSREFYFSEVARITNEKLVGSIQIILIKLCKDYIKYDPSLPHSILQYAMKHIDDYNDTDTAPITLTVQFEAMICLHVAKMVCHTFKKLNNRFIVIMRRMETTRKAQKDNLYTFFEHTVNEDNSKAAADLICIILRTHINLITYKAMHMKPTITVNSAESTTSLARTSLFDASKPWKHLNSALECVKQGISQATETAMHSEQNNIGIFVSTLDSAIGNTIVLDDKEKEFIKKQNIPDWKVLKNT